MMEENKDLEFKDYRFKQMMIYCFNVEANTPFKNQNSEWVHVVSRDRDNIPPYINEMVLNCNKIKARDLPRRKFKAPVDIIKIDDDY